MITECYYNTPRTNSLNKRSIVFIFKEFNIYQRGAVVHESSQTLVFAAAGEYEFIKKLICLIEPSRPNKYTYQQTPPATSSRASKP